MVVFQFIVIFFFKLPEDDGPQSVLASKLKVPETSEETVSPIVKYMVGDGTDTEEKIENAQQVNFRA